MLSTANKVIKKISSNPETELDNETIVMVVRTGILHSFDEVAKDVWRELSEPIKIQCLVDRLMKIYDVDRDVCTKDVIILIEELHEKGLVEISDEEDE